jgi:hypothetical protein
MIIVSNLTVAKSAITGVKAPNKQLAGRIISHKALTSNFDNRLTSLTNREFERVNNLKVS